MLMLGAPDGASGFRAIFAAMFAVPRLELGPDGGGDLRRGDMGHCDVVVEPEAVAVLGTLLGSLDPVSVPAEVSCWSCCN